MSGRVFVREYAAPPVDRREILRYGGARGSVAEVETLLEECLTALLPHLSYRVCFGELPVIVRDDAVTLGEATVISAALAQRLTGCDGAILFAATVGHEPDRLIARYGAVSPARALLTQAIGTERVEALCDRFEAEMREERTALGKSLRGRFSPGYGDLPLAFQREIFAYLNCSARIGVCLGESLLMSPSKSVTAIIGIEKSE